MHQILHRLSAWIGHESPPQMDTTTTAQLLEEIHRACQTIRIDLDLIDHKFLVIVERIEAAMELVRASQVAMRSNTSMPNSRRRPLPDETPV